MKVAAILLLMAAACASAAYVEKAIGEGDWRGKRIAWWPIACGDGPVFRTAQAGQAFSASRSLRAFNGEPRAMRLLWLPGKLLPPAARPADSRRPPPPHLNAT